MAKRKRIKVLPLLASSNPKVAKVLNTFPVVYKPLLRP
jgi:hypothetical protein